jgi:hypothetical protein
MPTPFRGKIELDIRDSVPDWDAFLAYKAPEGAANVLANADVERHRAAMVRD